MKHGKRSSYNNYKCRCDLCVKANSDYKRQYRRTGTGASSDWGKSHGHAGYARGCRCDLCKQARRDTSTLSNYSLTPEQIRDLLDTQSNACPICSQDISGAYHIDHDHSSGRVRGLLCTRCNSGMGRFNDDETLLLGAINYLTKYERTPL